MYDELLSLTRDGSARTMSPGRPTTSVPPSLIADDGADGAVRLTAAAGADGAGGRRRRRRWRRRRRPGRPRTGSPRWRRSCSGSNPLHSRSLSSCFFRGGRGSSSDRYAIGSRSPADPGMILRCRLDVGFLHRLTGIVRRNVGRCRPAGGCGSRPPIVASAVGDRGSRTTDVGTFSAQWQATRWPPPMSRNSGSIVEQFSGLPSCSRSQHRVWKRQPGGGAAGDGTSPFRTSRFLRIRGSGVGDRRQERHACTDGAGGGRAPRPRTARRACRGTSRRPGR